MIFMEMFTPRVEVMIMEITEAVLCMAFSESREYPFDEKAASQNKQIYVLAEALQKYFADLGRVRTAVVVGLPPAEGSTPVLQLDDGGRFYVLAVADADQAMLGLVPPDSVRRHQASEAIDLWWDAVDDRLPSAVATRLDPWLQA